MYCYAFQENKLSTKFCDEHTDDILQRINKSKDEIGLNIPLATLALFSFNNQNKKTEEQNIWDKIGYWRNIMKLSFNTNNNDEILEMDNIAGNSYRFIYNNEPFEVSIVDQNEESIELLFNDKNFKSFISSDNTGKYQVNLDGSIFEIVRNDFLGNGDGLYQNHNDDEGSLFAPMPGKVIKVVCAVGDKVKRGSILLIVEAMKMENNIVASHDAIVEKIPVKEGDMVDTDVQLVVLEEL